MQRYFSSIKEGNKLILNKDDMYHIKTVMRNHDGDKVEVVYNNTLHICKIDHDNIVIESIIPNKEKNKKHYTLCVPLLQEQKMSFVLQKATELGIDEIIPILTTRSMVKIDGKVDKKFERWNKICKEASEQSKRLDIPKISDVRKISELNLDGLKIVCSTQEKQNNIKKVLKNNPNCDKIIIVVGPEGGLTKEEEDILKSLDFELVTLGENIMRVETVPIYLLSVLNYEMME